MSGSLDQFLPPYPTRPKQDTAIFVQDKCSKCGTLIPITEPKYTLKIKGKEAPYCSKCAKKILRPQENIEENI